jgi:hypothetical protein
MGANMNWAQLAVNNGPDIHAADMSASATAGTGTPPPSPPPADEGEEAPPTPTAVTLEEHADISVAISQAENEEQIEGFRAEEAAVAEGRANFDANGGFNLRNRRSVRGYRGELPAATTTSTDTADGQAPAGSRNV